MRLADWDKLAASKAEPAKAAPAEPPKPEPPKPEAARAAPDALKVYGLAVEAVREAVGGAADKADTRRMIESAAHALVELLENDPWDLLLLCERSTPGDYLHAHAVNTAILAVRVAQGLEWGADRLRDAAEAALWHDAALALHIGLCRLGRAVPADAYAESVLHPLEISEHARSVAETVAAFHEKLGWLMGREGWSGSQSAAHLVSLCALHESITHWRPWRACFLPSVAMRMTASGHNHPPCDAFVRPLLSQLGLYPVGSWVRLSNRELGVVTKIKPGMVLRPEVATLVAADGSLKDAPTRIDLSRSPLIGVQEAVDPATALRSQPRLLARLKMSRWWLPA